MIERRLRDSAIVVCLGIRRSAFFGLAKKRRGLLKAPQSISQPAGSLKQCHAGGKLCQSRTISIPRVEVVAVQLKIGPTFEKVSLSPGLGIGRLNLRLRASLDAVARYHIIDALAVLQ